MADPTDTAIEQSPKFTWGDCVEVTNKGREQYPIHGNGGSVCGMALIDTTVRAKPFNVDLGSYVYLVEDCTGHAIEIPEKYLTLLYPAEEHD